VHLDAAIAEVFGPAPRMHRLRIGDEKEALHSRPSRVYWTTRLASIAFTPTG
jgi:hypothetical protein